VKAGNALLPGYVCGTRFSSQLARREKKKGRTGPPKLGNEMSFGGGKSMPADPKMKRRTALRNLFLLVKMTDGYKK